MDPRFIVVTMPEACGVYQSRRVVKDLKQQGLIVQRVVVNNAVINPDSDFLCLRRQMQQTYIEMPHDDFGAEALTIMPLLPYEVKGIERLKEVEKILFRAG